MKKRVRVDIPVHYFWSGRFVSPSEEWVHLTRQLMEYEMFFVTEGTLYIADQEQKYVVSKNEYLIMPPTVHQYGYQNSKCSFYWFHFSGNELLTEDFSKESIGLQGTVKNMERIIILLNQLQDVARRYQHQKTMDLQALGILLEVFNQTRVENSRNVTSSKVKIYESVLNYVAWNRYQRISVHEMAQYLGYHEKYLSTVFKERAGISLKQYILQEVMECAKAQMMDTNKTIAQIAYGVGYSDPHNFSHAFKKTVGISPKEYRNLCMIPAKIK